MKLRGLVNLVTGGCSGLGLETARHLVSHGGKVVLIDVNESAGADCVAELGPQNSHFFKSDVTDEATLKQAFTESSKVFGDIRAYVNCAGITQGDNLINQNGTHDADIFRKVMDVNLFGTFLSTALAAEQLKKLPVVGKERGVIINTSSTASRYGFAGFAGYSATKRAIQGMLLPVARELGLHRIRVVNIAPGMMVTPMNANVAQEILDKVASLTLKGELGQAQHFAQAVEAIITNGYLNGTTIKLDDGIIPPVF